MKKLLALALSLVMAFSLVACGGGSEENNGGDAELLPVQPETIKILAQSTREAEVNILRDQLSHAGFIVEADMQPDYASVSAAREKATMISVFQVGQQVQVTWTMLFVVSCTQQVTTTIHQLLTKKLTD